MSAVKSLRLPEKLLQAVRQRARREHLDEATAIRQLLAMGATEYAVNLYREGRVTLGEAADLADVFPREMLEILWNRGVKGNITLDQQRKAIEYVMRGLVTGPASPKTQSKPSRTPGTKQEP